MKAQILIVEDQSATAELIRGVLEEEGCEIQVVETLDRAREKLKKALPDVLVLDRQLPDGDGLDVLRDLRAERRSEGLPVLVLTARKAVAEKVEGLKSGADDYLAKPFSPEELVARIEALLRRAGKIEEPKSITCGDLKLEGESRRAFLGRREISLSGKEFDLLWAVARRKGKVMTRDFLLQHVWGYEQGLELTTKVVDVTMSHLREKLGDYAKRITAVRGFGYRLD